MEEVAALALGFVLDQVLGDPPSRAHPVRWLGCLIQLLEVVLRRLLPERLGGIVLLALVTATAGGAAWLGLEAAALWHPWARVALATLLVYLGLAARGLARHARHVLDACTKSDWDEARRRLSGIVGRDTRELSSEEIYRACIETVAENTTDGVVAPLFFAALAGPVGLWAYKAVNTLDSMVGYRNARYLRFGWASARMDDAANYLPARLTWLLLALAAALLGRRGGSALRTGWRDGRKHPSPNAAWGEATMAGALGVRLGGTSAYGGVVSHKPLLGDAVEALTEEKARTAITLMLLSSWLALGLALPVRFATGLALPAYLNSSNVGQGNHEAFANSLRIAHERLHRRVGALACFEFREGGAVHARAIGHVGETQALRFARDLQLRQQLLQLIESSHALMVPGDQVGQLLGYLRADRLVLRRLFGREPPVTGATPQGHGRCLLGTS